MPAIRSITEIAAKWSDVTPRREAYYKSGVERPKKVWEDMAKAAGPAWKAGVDEAGEKGFVGGVAAAGQAKWSSNTVRKGVTQARWRTEVAIAGPEYNKKFGPFADTIAGTTLSPRGRTGDPGNYKRVEEMGTALHAKKIALRG